MQKSRWTLHGSHQASRGALPSARWDPDDAFELCAEGQEAQYEGRLQFLDKDVVKSVRAAAQCLNAGRIQCSDGVCAAFSEKRRQWYLLHASESKEAALIEVLRRASAGRAARHAPPAEALQGTSAAAQRRACLVVQGVGSAFTPVPTVLTYASSPMSARAPHPSPRLQEMAPQRTASPDVRTTTSPVKSQAASTAEPPLSARLPCRSLSMNTRGLTIASSPAMGAQRSLAASYVAPPRWSSPSRTEDALSGAPRSPPRTARGLTVSSPVLRIVSSPDRAPHPERGSYCAPVPRIRLGDLTQHQEAPSASRHGSDRGDLMVSPREEARLHAELHDARQQAQAMRKEAAQSAEQNTAVRQQLQEALRASREAEALRERLENIEGVVASLDARERDLTAKVVELTKENEAITAQHDQKKECQGHPSGESTSTLYYTIATRQNSEAGGDSVVSTHSGTVSSSASSSSKGCSGVMSEGSKERQALGLLKGEQGSKVRQALDLLKDKISQRDGTIALLKAKADMAQRKLKLADMENAMLKTQLLQGGFEQ